MKPRRIMLIFILNYLLIVFVSIFGEFLFLGSASKNMQLMIRTAGDMALEQVQVSDDFFKPGEGYMLDSEGVKTDAFRINVADSGGSYKQVSAYETLTGKTEKKDIFNTLYRGRIPQYISEVPRILDVEMNVGYWQEGMTSMQFYKIPKIGIMGRDITGPAAVKAYQGNMQASQAHVEGIWKNYEMNKSEKQAYMGDGSVESYFMTPISLGLTYIDAELLQYFFMSNLDMLMRGKYAKNGTNLNSTLGGEGILKGETFSQYVSEDLNSQNPINNGEFTLLRGERVVKDGGLAFYRGKKPTIRYKVIDMYAPENDAVLKMLYGYESSKRGSDGTKAAYLREQDTETDPATGVRPSEKPIVLAEVTFYADVLVPYRTIPIREMRATTSESGELQTKQLFGLSGVDPQPGNYIDIVRDGDLGSGVGSEMGNNSDVFMYKRLFAVAP